MWQTSQQLFQHYKTTSIILNRILKSSHTLEESSRILGERLTRRKENFLELVEKTIFEFPNSPYLKLLDRAGISFEDTRNLVEEHGIEATLKILYEEGVYIDILEFKGKKEVIRGKDVFHFKEKDFSNPMLTEGVKTSSGGTRSSGTKMVVPLEYIAEHTPYNILAARECDLMERKVIIWLPILPAGEGLFFNLRFTAMRNPPVKWFSQVDEKYINPSLVDKLKTKITILTARLYGKRMPGPEFVDIRNTIHIARWMHNNRGRSKGFCIVTYASSALRLMLEAKTANFDLGESVFWLMGEPLTSKVQEVVESAGCQAYSLYGCNELMLIGQCCGNADEPDDMHLCMDKLAAIQRKRSVAHSESEVDGFLFTTLLKSSPKIFLNTETGDYGVIEKKKCGCGFERLGFTEHIHSVRSFEKLTAEGATFIGSDLLPLVQSTLPQKLGGSATDYQFIEEPDQNGVPRFFMLISPDIGAIDEKEVRGLVFTALTAGEYSHSYSQSYWTQADTFQIIRKNPIPTARGKILPLHISARTLSQQEKIASR